MIRWPRIVLILVILSGITAAVLWDKYELNREFVAVERLLQTARITALEEKRRVVVRFLPDDGEIKVCGRCLSVPCLCDVQYDTTLGPDRIVFDSQGTRYFNLREHGGDLTLESFSGLFERHIAVNCNGMVREGVYPE